MTKWISVENGLPSEDCEEVLIAYQRVCCECLSYSELYYYAVGYYDILTDLWSIVQPFNHDIEELSDTPIHVKYWMQIVEVQND